MSNQRFYDEDETERILALAGKPAIRRDGYGVDDLQRAASELNISPQVVQEASEQIYLRREEEADRREYRRQQFRKILLLSLLPVLYTATVLWLNSHSRHHNDLAALIFPVLSLWLIVVFQFQNVFGKMSTDEEIKFRKWRMQRIGRVAPDQLKPMIEQDVVGYCRYYKHSMNPYSLADFLQDKYGITRQAAFDFTNGVLGADPSLRALCTPIVQDGWVLAPSYSPPPIVDDGWIKAPTYVPPPIQSEISDRGS